MRLVCLKFLENKGDAEIGALSPKVALVESEGRFRCGRNCLEGRKMIPGPNHITEEEECIARANLATFPQFEAQIEAHLRHIRESVVTETVRALNQQSPRRRETARGGSNH